MPLILELSEGTSILELWSPPLAYGPPHPFVPCNVDDAMALLRDANPRRLRDAADTLGGRTEHDDEGALLVLARAWVDGRVSLHARPHIVGRTEPIESDIVNLADLADLADLEPPKRESPSTWFEVCLVDELGEPIPDIALVFDHEGNPSDSTTDGDGVARLDVEGVSFASARVADAAALAAALAPRWRTVREGDLPPATSETTFVILAERLVPRASLRGRQRHTLCVQPPRRAVAIIEMEDVTFHFDSPVFLPATQAGTPAQDRATGLDVIAAVLRFAEEHPDQSLIIAGHTDTSGADAYNESLSERRASSAAWVSTGDRASWISLVDADHKTEDVQAILCWAAQELGWGCDPGPIDGVAGTKTTAAIRGFQQAHSDAIATVSVDGAMGPQTWGAVFDAYERALVRRLGGEQNALVRMRGALRFVDESTPTVGCGEKYPIEARFLDEYRSPANRRVEFLFFEPWEIPDGLDAATLCDEVYRSDSCFDREYLRVGGDDLSPILRVVPSSWSTMGNVIAYAEAVSGTIPPDVRTLGIGSAVADNTWLASDGRLYFVPPDSPDASIATINLIEPGRVCAVAPLVSASGDGLVAAASLREQMRVLQEAVRVRVTDDRARDAPHNEVVLRYKAVMDHADMRLRAALDRLEAECEQARTDPAVSDEIDALVAENGRACDDHLPAVFTG